MKKNFKIQMILLFFIVFSLFIPLMSAATRADIKVDEYIIERSIANNKNQTKTLPSDIRLQGLGHSYGGIFRKQFIHIESLYIDFDSYIPDYNPVKRVVAIPSGPTGGRPLETLQTYDLNYSEQYHSQGNKPPVAGEKYTQVWKLDPVDVTGVEYLGKLLTIQVIGKDGDDYYEKSFQIDFIGKNAPPSLFVTLQGVSFILFILIVITLIIKIILSILSCNKKEK